MTDLFEETAPLRAHPWFGHAFGIVGLLLALWLRFEIGDELLGYPFIASLPVVVLTAFLGGVVPGALCAIFAGLASWWFFVPPVHSSSRSGRAASSPWPSTPPSRRWTSS